MVDKIGLDDVADDDRRNETITSCPGMCMNVRLRFVAPLAS